MRTQQKHRAKIKKTAYEEKVMMEGGRKREIESEKVRDSKGGRETERERQRERER